MNKGIMEVLEIILVTFIWIGTDGLFRILMTRSNLPEKYHLALYLAISLIAISLFLHMKATAKNN
jgi:hypothetical protein